MSEQELPTEEVVDVPSDTVAKDEEKPTIENSDSDVMTEAKDPATEERPNPETDGDENIPNEDEPQEEIVESREEPSNQIDEQITEEDAKAQQIEYFEDDDQASEVPQNIPELAEEPETQIVASDMEEHFENQSETEENISMKYEIESQIGEADSIEEFEAHPLDELNDQQVIDIVNEVEAENRHLELENILFENFLKENDPSLLDGMEEIMTFLLKRQTISYTSSKDTTTQDRPSVTIDRQRLRLDSYTSITSIAEGKGPKINLSQKTDMVMRAMEENQASLEAFLKRSHIIKRNLKSELEEFSIREVEIKEATEIFEFNVVTQGIDKLTQRIPAEKFVRYMEEWLKSAQLQIEKLRLRIATLKVQYKKVSQQLIQRQELGENVHAVDFDQLEIENKHFLEKIEQKNIHLIELKKMNGGANLVLSTHKKFLQRQQEDCNKLKAEIELKKMQIEMTEKECEEAEDELNEVYEKYEHCKNLKNQYTVPEVMEYVKLKSKLHELKKNIKIWSRRRKIQEIALNTCIREMKSLTGSTNVDPSWFEDDHSFSSEDMSSLRSSSLDISL